MYKSTEFDYDLWTTNEGGTKRYWARVKATGEVTEISHEVMCFLRSEEKKMFRENAAIKKHGSPLSLDLSLEEEKEYWFDDHGIGMSEMEIALVEEDFRKLLTPIQRAVFDECIIGSTPLKDFANDKGIAKQSVSDVIDGIQKKAKKFFG